MRLEWIEDILSVIDTGSLTQAAQNRFLTQSAFTRRIRLIEQAIGTTLFDRTVRPVRPLAHVRDQESEMRAVALKLRALKNALTDPVENSARRVSFACQHTIATTISPGLIRELTHDGEVSVRVKSSNRDDCLMMLLTSEVDFAVIFEALDSTHKNENGVLLEEVIGADWMIPVIATDFKKQFTKAMNQQVLPIITYPQNLHLGQLFDLEFIPKLEESYQIKRIAETGLALAALHYALEGIGIGWLPRSIAVRDIEQGRLLDVSGNLPSKKINVKIVRLHKDMSELAEQAWNQIAIKYKESQASAHVVSDLGVLN